MGYIARRLWVPMVCIHVNSTVFFVVCPAGICVDRHVHFYQNSPNVQKFFLDVPPKSINFLANLCDLFGMMKT